MEIPAMRDMLQEVDGALEVPEIRVWCHPHKIGKEGSDYYAVFESFEKALKFCKTAPESEDAPLIAYGGYEINIFRIDVSNRR